MPPQANLCNGQSSDNSLADTGRGSASLSVKATRKASSLHALVTATATGLCEPADFITGATPSLTGSLEGDSGTATFGFSLSGNTATVVITAEDFVSDTITMDGTVGIQGSYTIADFTVDRITFDDLTMEWSALPHTADGNFEVAETTTQWDVIGCMTIDGEPFDIQAQLDKPVIPAPTCPDDQGSAYYASVFNSSSCTYTTLGTAITSASTFSYDTAVALSAQANFTEAQILCYMQDSCERGDGEAGCVDINSVVAVDESCNLNVFDDDTVDREECNANLVSSCFTLTSQSICEAATMDLCDADADGGILCSNGELPRDPHNCEWSTVNGVTGCRVTGTDYDDRECDTGACPMMLVSCDGVDLTPESGSPALISDSTPTCTMTFEAAVTCNTLTVNGSPGAVYLQRSDNLAAVPLSAVTCNAANTVATFTATEALASGVTYQFRIGGGGGANGYTCVQAGETGGGKGFFYLRLN